MHDAGGTGANSLYEDTDPLSSTTIIVNKGCYADSSSDRRLPTMLANTVPSVAACADLAGAAGLKYFGLQGGGQCWGGDDFDRATALGASSGSCNVLCSSGGPLPCGNAGVNSIYTRVAKGA